MIKYLMAFVLFASPCLAGMGIGGFPYPGPGVMETATTAGGVYTDNFNRADENPLSGSGTWTNPGGSYSALRVYSNAVTSPSAVGIAHYSTTSHTFNANQYSQVKITTTDNNVAGPIVRYSGSGNFYSVSVSYGDVSVARVRADGNGQIFSVASGQSINGKILKISSSGATPTTIKVYIDGVQVGSDIIDNSAYVITSGQPGIMTDSTGTVDDWQGGEL